MQKYYKLILISMLLALFGSGCYTIFKHPGEESSSFAKNRDSDCISCHPYYHDNYGSTQLYYPDYWNTYDRFGRYYAEPWWWDYYWYDANHGYVYDKEDSDNPRSGGGQEVTRPSGLLDPGSTYFPTITRGSSGSSGSSSGGTPSKTTTGESETKVETKTRDNESSSSDSSSSDDQKKATKKSTRMKRQ